MRRSLCCVVLGCFSMLASVAVAQDGDSGKSDSSEHPGSGALIEVDVFGVNSLGSVTSLISGTGTTPITISPSAAVGYAFGDNAILLDIGLLGFGPGTNVGLSADPAFRHYFKALHTGHVSPFVQGGVVFGIISPANGQADYVIGLDGGAGAEWLFVKNLSIVVDALLEYAHATIHNGGGGLTTNIDTIGIAGNVGVVVHF